MARFHSKTWQPFVHFTQTTNERANEMSCSMWRNQVKHLTSYQWMREQITGLQESFSNSLKSFYSKSSLSRRATHTRKTTTSQNQTFFLSIILSLHSPIYLVLFSTLTSFGSLRRGSNKICMWNAVLSCFTVIGLERKAEGESGYFFVFTIVFMVAFQGFLTK